MDKALLVRKDNFKIQEVDFSKLKEFTNNIILEYTYNSENNKYFRRSLFELDRLGFNIGILCNNIHYVSLYLYLKDVIDSIKGFKINLGVWVELYDDEDYNYLYKPLSEKFNNNFITGIIDSTYSDYKELSVPKWGKNCDIEPDGLGVQVNNEYINILSLSTDYKTIYDENNLKPIRSDLNVAEYI